MEKVALLTESQIADLIRQTALAVANDLREDLLTARTREIMTKAEAAKYLGVSIATINRYMAQQMPYEKIEDNGRPLFRRSEIDSWMRSKNRERIQTICR
jgi:transposase